MKKLRDDIEFLNGCISELAVEMTKVPQDGHMYQYFKRRHDGLVRVRAWLCRFLNYGKAFFNG